MMVLRESRHRVVFDCIRTNVMKSALLCYKCMYLITNSQILWYLFYLLFSIIYSSVLIILRGLSKALSGS